MALLANLYAAASLGKPGARRLGSSNASIVTGRYQGALYRRKRLLEEAIATGKLSKSTLGAKDQALIAPQRRNTLAALSDSNSPFKKSGGGFSLGGVGGFLGHLGSDIFNTAKGLPGGIYEQGKAIAHDIEHQHDPLNQQSEVKRDVIDPVAKSYGETYGHGPGHFFHQFYQHPLGPILDAATVLSLGASGAARAGAATVARAAPESRAAEIGGRLTDLTSREGRAPIHAPGLPGVGELEREYTPRPLAKMGQRLLDVMSGIGDTSRNPLFKWQYSGAVRKELRESHAAMDALTASMTADEMRALRPIADLDPNESRALFFTKMGVGHPELLKEYSNMVDETLVDAEKMRELKNLGVDPAYIRANSTITPEVKLLVEHPNDRMMKASDAWDRAVERGTGPEELSIDPEQHDTRVKQARSILLKRMGWEKGEITPWYHGAETNRLPRKAEDFGDLSVPAQFDEPGKRGLPGGTERRFTFHAGTEQAARDRLRSFPGSGRILKLYPKNLRNQIAYMDEPVADGGGYSTSQYGSGNHYWRIAEEMQNKTLGPDIKTRLRRLKHMHDLLVEGGQRPETDMAYVLNMRAIRGDISIANDVRRLKGEGAQGVAYKNTGEDAGSTSILGFNKEDWHAIDNEEGTPFLESVLGENYVPMVPAESYAHRRTFIDKLFKRNKAPETTGDFTYRGEHQGVRFNNISDRALYAPDNLRALHTSSGETFTTGTFRTDARVFLEHRIQVIRHTVDQAFKKEQVLQWAFKDEEGEVVRYRTQAEVDRQFGKGKMVLVHDTFPVSWYHSEIDHLKKVIDTIDGMEQHGMDIFGDTGMEEVLSKLADTDAQAFVKSNWGALRNKGVAVPRQIAEYQHQFGKLGNAAYGPVGRFLGRWMHRWRNAVLTYMPRWAFNTAAGSFLMTMVRGVTPMDFREASKLARTYINPGTGEQIVRPSFFARHLMKKPDINREGLESAMPHGVTLAHQAELEVMDMASSSYLNQLGIRFPTRKLLHGVQAIEDYFRRAMFVTNLRREQRLKKAAYGGRDVEIPEVEPRHIADGSQPVAEPPVPNAPDPGTVSDADHYGVLQNLHDQLDAEIDDLSEKAQTAAHPDARDALDEQIDAKMSEKWALEQQMQELSPGQHDVTAHDDFTLDPEAGPTPVTMTADIQNNDWITIDGYPYTAGDSTPDGWFYFEEGHHPQYNPEGATMGITLEELQTKIDEGAVQHVKATEPSSDPNVEANLPDDQEMQHEQAMQEVGHVLKDHYDQMLNGFRGNVAEALQDPEVVRRSLQETNKMMYNYMILGPFERRYVRQFVPFWGWYKFISQVAWRLPVEMPGRVNIIRWLSLVGQEQEKQFGPMPDWLKGVIPLSKPGDKTFKYLSTLGMNPFGQFFDPLNAQTLKGAPSQLNPGIQAIMQTVGFDPLTGDRVRVSPESGVSEDFFGRLYRAGHQVSMAEVEPGYRFAGSLLRSIPQVRTGQQFGGGGSVYPEDVPFIHPRPMGGAGGSSPQNVGQLGLSYFGVMPKTYDLKAFQQLNLKSAAYARQKNLRDRQRLRRKSLTP
jgi:hypothetical protein